MRHLPTCLVFLFLAGTAQAAPGTLDPTFGDGGKLVRPEAAWPTAAVPTPDGKLLVAVYDASKDLVVKRFMATGALDPTFDGDGTAEVDAGGLEQANDLELAPDGRIYVAGEQGSTTVVARLKPDGALDKSFGLGPVEGVVVGGSYRSAITLAPEGDLLLIASTAGEEQIYVQRFDQDGTPYAPSDPAGSETVTEYVTAAATAPDGSVVAAGEDLSHNTDPGVTLVRFTPAGTVDETFGTKGVLHLDELTLVRSLVPRPDGSLLVGGTTRSGGSRHAVMRVGDTGDADEDFGAGGIATLDAVGRDELTSLTVAPDGTLLVAGQTAGPATVVAARLRADGSPDPAFGTGGITSVPFGADSLAGSGALVGDRFVLTGITTFDGVTANLVLAAVRTTDDPPPAPSPSPSPAPSPSPEPSPSPSPAGTPSPDPADREAPRLGAVGIRDARRPAVRFTLSEPARVTIVARRGARARTVERTLAAGRHRVRLGRLARGRYWLTIFAADAAGNRAVNGPRRFRHRR